MIHWTARSTDDFLYQIAADFVAQLEDKIQTESWTKAELAEKLGISKGRVSQILNNPGNLGLRTIVRLARALGMKVAIVAYDDNDHENRRGPINSDIFRICWENSGRPVDFWSLQEQHCVAINVTTMHLRVKIQVINVTETPLSHAFYWSRKRYQPEAWKTDVWSETLGPISRIDELKDVAISATSSQIINMVH